MPFNMPPLMLDHPSDINRNQHKLSEGLHVVRLACRRKDSEDWAISYPVEPEVAFSQGLAAFLGSIDLLPGQRMGKVPVKSNLVWLVHSLH